MVRVASNSISVMVLVSCATTRASLMRLTRRTLPRFLRLSARGFRGSQKLPLPPLRTWPMTSASYKMTSFPLHNPASIAPPLRKKPSKINNDARRWFLLLVISVSEPLREKHFDPAATRNVCGF